MPSSPLQQPLAVPSSSDPSLSLPTPSENSLLDNFLDKILPNNHSYELRPILAAELASPTRSKSLNKEIAKSTNIAIDIVRKTRSSKAYRRCFRMATNLNFLTQFHSKPPTPYSCSPNHHPVSLPSFFNNEVCKYLYLTNASLNSLLDVDTPDSIKSEIISTEYTTWLTRLLGSPVIASRPKRPPKNQDGHTSRRQRRRLQYKSFQNLVRRDKKHAYSQILAGNFDYNSEVSHIPDESLFLLLPIPILQTPSRYMRPTLRLSNFLNLLWGLTA